MLGDVLGDISESPTCCRGKTGAKPEVDHFSQLFAWGFLFAVDQSRHLGGMYNDVQVLMCALIYMMYGGVCLPV